MIRLNQRGEGLISVMISVAILGVLIITMVTLYQLFGTMMAKSLLRREADLLGQRVREIMLRRNLCEKALSGNTWDGNAEQDITIWERPGVKLAEAGMTLAQGRLVMQKVYIRPLKIDAAGDSHLVTLTTTTLGTSHLQTVRPRAGEVVIRFGLASDAVGQGELSERKAAVVVIVDPNNGHLIKDCDINEESVATGKDCTVADAVEDGFDCGPPPPPQTIVECKRTAFVTAIDAFGDPKCGCSWHCVMPYYQNRGPTAIVNCSPASSINAGQTACPPDTVNGTGRDPCPGKVGEYCYWKVWAPGECPGPGIAKWSLRHARCMLP